jgi:sulfide dehydrogenase (flavoprotein) subunit SudA (EC 1.97.-.-)
MEDKEKKPKRKIVPNKTKMPEQPPQERVKNFKEVPLGYSEDQAVEEATRCIQCKNRPCIEGCPVEIDIPDFIALIAERKFVDAARKMKEKNALPAVCGRVCPQEVQCESKCTLGKKNEPVAVGRLERFIADWERENKMVQVPPRPAPRGKKVAVIGAGPAGLTVAADLAKIGFGVTIFEALHKDRRGFGIWHP